MKCELCNSGRCEPEQKLCEPCIEVIARLWAIANSPGPAIHGAGQTADKKANFQRASGAARPPSAVLL